MDGDFDCARFPLVTEPASQTEISGVSRKRSAGHQEPQAMSRWEIPIRWLALNDRLSADVGRGGGREAAVTIGDVNGSAIGVHITQAHKEVMVRPIGCGR
jgi:hypothetical protein